MFCARVKVAFMYARESSIYVFDKQQNPSRLSTLLVMFGMGVIFHGGGEWSSQFSLVCLKKWSR